jgi:hypothetical protein
VRHVLERDVEQQPDVRIVERVVDVPSLLTVADKPARAQQAQAVRAGGLREPGRGGEVADAELARFEQGEDQADAARVGERVVRSSGSRARTAATRSGST